MDSNIVIDPLNSYYQEKETNKLLLKQIKELKYYKEVMEVSYTKIHNEKIEILQKNKDYENERYTFETTIRKLRQSLSKAKKELNDIKPNYLSNQNKINILEMEVKKLKNEKNIAIEYLGKGKQEAYWRDKYSIPI